MKCSAAGVNSCIKMGYKHSVMYIGTMDVCASFWKSFEHMRYLLEIREEYFRQNSSSEA